jgi:hypothetical protein
MRVDEEYVRYFARLGGLTLSTREMPELIAALESQLATNERLAAVELDEFETIVPFDPAWG